MRRVFVKERDTVLQSRHLSVQLLSVEKWSFLLDQSDGRFVKGTVLGSFRGHYSSVRHLKKSEGRFSAAKIHAFRDDPDASTHLEITHSEYAYQKEIQWRRITRQFFSYWALD